MNPLIRWVGSKRSLLSTLIGCLPTNIDELTYNEPFAGSAALFMAIASGREGAADSLLSDTNIGLMAMYTAVKTDPEHLIQTLSAMAYRHAADADTAFGEYRASYNSGLATGFGSIVQAGAQFMYLQATGFNGVYRTNKRGMYNVPRGDVKNPRICNPDEIRAAHKLLQGVGLVCADFSSVITDVGDGHFMYLDPPYDVAPGKPGFTAYSASGFGADKQRELAMALQAFSKRGGLFMLSNGATDYVRELYDGYHIEEVSGRRSVSQSGSGRGYVTELLIRNYY